MTEVPSDESGARHPRASAEALQRELSRAIGRAARMLADAGLDQDGTLVTSEGTCLTRARIRRSVEGAVREEGLLPADSTTVGEGDGTAETPLRADEPIRCRVEARGSEGSVGTLTRTFVVDGSGGPERRAHVALTHAFRSVESMLTSGEHTVGAVETDLKAEIAAFGFGPDALDVRVSGTGREPIVEPTEFSTTIPEECALRIEAAVTVAADGPTIGTDSDAASARTVALGDVLWTGPDGSRPEWLAAPSRSLDPVAVAEK